jgi:hypothetical protein
VHVPQQHVPTTVGTTTQAQQLLVIHDVIASEAPASNPDKVNIEANGEIKVSLGRALEFE